MGTRKYLSEAQSPTVLTATISPAVVDTQVTEQWWLSNNPFHEITWDVHKDGGLWLHN